MELNFGIVEGLPDEEQRQLRELKYIYMTIIERQTGRNAGITMGKLLCRK